MSTPSPTNVQSPRELDFISHSPAQTIRVGQRLGELLRPGDLVLLQGEFGAGKTHLTKGIAQGLGSADLVTSPSFVLINEYRAGEAQGRFAIYHADLYRIAEAAELPGIGLDDALSGDGVCLIEWPEQALGWLSDDYLVVQLRHLSETKRVLRFVPHGKRYEDLLEAFKRTAFA
jgi:tRNA threonylcarbamoyladenosine biosynthesis protein TsaE